jgi:hypothetical protein
VSHRALAFAVGLIASASLAAPALAHTGHEVGEYILEIGWLHEPAFVGQPNAVQVTITHHDDGAAIIDLGSDDLTVVVSTAGVDSPSLVLEAAFDAVEKTGPLGEYDAAIVPTAPGDYTFHITGSIHDTAVDLSVTSGDETFDAVATSSELEFPAKMPTLTEVGTRLDRIDGRIEELQVAVDGGDNGDLDERLAQLQTAVNAAHGAADSANRNAQLGFFVGLIGILLALRARRRAATPGTGAG